MADFSSEVPKRTPWGATQYASKWLPGVYMVGTAGHGGLYIKSKAIKDLIPDYMKAVSTGGTGTWYEEDCAWAAAIVPLLCGMKNVVLLDGTDLYADAMKALRTWYPEQYEKFFGVELAPGESFIKDQKRFHEDNKERLVVVSASMYDEDKNFVKVWATKGGVRTFDAEEFMFLVPATEYENRNRHGFVIESPLKYQRI